MSQSKWVSKIYISNYLSQLALNISKRGLINNFTLSAINKTGTNDFYIIKCYFALNPSQKIVDTSIKALYNNFKIKRQVVCHTDQLSS